MSARWAALGVVGFAVWLIATFGVVYVAVELAGDDEQTQAIVIGRSNERVGHPDADGNPIRVYCVAYTTQGPIGEICETTLRDAPPACYLDAEPGKRLPGSCQFPDSN